ncbi:uncharacterized protein LOC142234164 [Haematobia irritans]|uniref:uncharacterized protein LOC142234164 n=1 Tax=Haematobia irritans TaxID=7368 RepID=UPI003F4FEA10
MSKIQLICVFMIMVIYGLGHQVHGQESDVVTESEVFTTGLPISTKDDDKSNQSTTPTTTTEPSSTRSGRLLKYPHRLPLHVVPRRRHHPVQIRSRADHFPGRPQLRRVHTGVLGRQPSVRYNYDSLKSSKYLTSKGSPTHYASKGNSLKQQLMDLHPNGVHVPALSQQYVQNFKASPNYNGKVVIHPVTDSKQQLGQSPENSYTQYIKPQHQQQLGQQQSLGAAAATINQQPPQAELQYPEFKQYPIPDQQKMQKYNEQHEKYLQQQQQQYLKPLDPVAYYQQQYEQQQQQHQLVQQQKSSYSVHQPAYVAAAAAVPAATQKPVLQSYHHHHHNIPPSIPIHNVETSLANSSPTLQAQSSYGHGLTASNPQSPPAKMYSVYEENDMTELQNNDYQTLHYDHLEKEAQEYLRFMNTNEYFLPKRDPNYKKIDEENDRRQQYNLQQQQASSSSSAGYAPATFQENHLADVAPSTFPKLSYQTKFQNSQEDQLLQHQQIHYGQHKDSASAASSLTPFNSQPIEVSKLFYQDQTNNNQQGSGSTVVRTSYQTGYNANQIVVNSQDSKVTKYIGSTQSPVSVNHVYSQVRQSPQSSLTPEPLRFEFTERDAMIGGFSFTNAPKSHLKYKAVDTPITPTFQEVTLNPAPTTARTVLATTLRSSTFHNGGIKPVVEIEDDPEDGDDMQSAGTHIYGRQPLQSNKKTTSPIGTSNSITTETPPKEQKDTEEYCERICAIVEDEHEEIVCGSDGYMYTSEAQMECYASCLHIDITIQGKGSCSAR